MESTQQLELQGTVHISILEVIHSHYEKTKALLNGLEDEAQKQQRIQSLNTLYVQTTVSIKNNWQKFIDFSDSSIKDQIKENEGKIVHVFAIEKNRLCNDLQRMLDKQLKMTQDFLTESEKILNAG